MFAVQNISVHVGEKDGRKILRVLAEGLEGVLKGLPCGESGDGRPKAFSLTY